MKFKEYLELAYVGYDMERIKKITNLLSMFSKSEFKTFIETMKAFDTYRLPEKISKVM